MSKVPLTVTGAEKLRVELHRLKTIERPSVIAAIAEARAHGDLSENAEYDAAKERQGFVEGRIKEVEGKLSNAQIIDPKLLDADGRCVFGATVEIEDQDSGEAVTYQIVGEDEADIKTGKLWEVAAPDKKVDIDLPASDVIQWYLDDGTMVTVRPSGTEPKIKFYVLARTAVGSAGLGAAKTESSAKVDAILAEIKKAIA